MAKSRLRLILIPLTILLIIASLAPAHPASARSGSAAEIMELVNNLRAGYGLAPYTVNSNLMASAQSHSNYQASIKTATHLHQDGRMPADMGIEENIATGQLMTPNIAVFQIWSDAIHMHTMVGFASGSMGAGIASDGTDSYYTLDVLPSGGLGGGTGTGSNTTVVGTPIPFAPLYTTTPQSDGQMYHIVGYGQSLWSIALAYGIHIEQIRNWNNIAANSNSIYTGQKLLVLPYSLVTKSPTTPTATPRPEENNPANLAEAVQNSTTPTIPASTPSGTASATQHARSTSTLQAAQPPSSPAAQGGTGLIVPLTAGTIILAGLTTLLFLFLRTNKKLA